jgi:hypothetical protein
MEQKIKFTNEFVRQARILENLVNGMLVLIRGLLKNYAKIKEHANLIC